MTQPNLAEQYRTDENLRIRIETHQHYGIGPPLEPAIDEALHLAGHESILDIGTGPGDFLLRLRRSGHRGRLVGLDNSPGMIAKAKSANSDIEFLQADAQFIPFADGSFDIITARHMLYHVPDIPQALHEIRRVLDATGRFLAVTNAHDNMRDYMDALRETAGALQDKMADEIRGMIPTRVSNAFSDRNGPPLIESVFGNVQIKFVESALRFETAEPALRYFDSCRTMKGLSIEDWDVARKAFAQVIARRLSNGPWVIAKTVVLLTATRI